MCDAIEGVSRGDANIPDANGVGLESALENYGNWFKNNFLPDCKSTQLNASITTGAETMFPIF